MSDQSSYELEKDYFLGNYQSCINKANSISSSTESIFYMCLSYFHLKKYELLQHEVSKSSEQCIKLIGVMVKFDENPEKREGILRDLCDLLQEKAVQPKDHLSRLVMSSMFARAKMYTEAIKTLHQLDSLPALSALVGVYLLMDRVDLAVGQLKLMQNKDDYSTITLFTAAQVQLAAGKFREAHDIGKELEDVYRATPLIKNIQTAAAVCLGNYDSAKQHCESSLDLDNDNPEALINMLHIMSKTGASAEIKERFYIRLKTLYPEHEFVREIETLKSSFS